MFTLPNAQAEINAHTERVRRPGLRCDLEQCPRCEGFPGAFHFHDRRRRLFRLIVDGMVKVLASLLVRWKCPLCRKAFTEYPPFALPRKRCVRDTPFAFADRYLEDDHRSYREAARDDRGRVFGYAPRRVRRRRPASRPTAPPESGPVPRPRPTKYKNRIDERQLHFTTVWRWTGFAGGLGRLLSRVTSLVREKDPASNLFRNIRPVPPWKHRSPERKSLLAQGLRLFSAASEFRRLFGYPIFPRLRNALLFEAA